MRGWLVVIALAGCSRQAAVEGGRPAPIVVAEPDAAPATPASAAASAPSAAPPPTAISLYRKSYEQLCPEIALLTTDAGAPRAPGDVDVVLERPRRRVKAENGLPASTEMVAQIVSAKLKVRHEVFRMRDDTDPYSCCGTASADGLDVSCFFSGADSIEMHATARAEGDALHVRWCNADLSTASVLDRGDKSFPASGAHLRFVAPKPACDPKVPGD